MYLEFKVYLIFFTLTGKLPATHKYWIFDELFVVFNWTNGYILEMEVNISMHVNDVVMFFRKKFIRFNLSSLSLIEFPLWTVSFVFSLTAVSGIDRILSDAAPLGKIACGVSNAVSDTCCWLFICDPRLLISNEWFVERCFWFSLISCVEHVAYSIAWAGVDAAIGWKINDSSSGKISLAKF